MGRCLAIIYLISLFLSILFTGVLVYSQSSNSTVYITVSNNTVYIGISGAKAVKYDTTIIRVGYINSSYIEIIYSGITGEVSPNLHRVRVDVYGVSGSLESLIASVTFDPSQVTSNTFAIVSMINVQGYKVLDIKIYDADTGELVNQFYLHVPPSWAGYAIAPYLSVLIPIGIIIAFALRGSLKDIGLGFLLAGIVYMLLPFIGIEVYNSIAVSAVSIGAGLLFLWLSSR